MSRKTSRKIRAANKPRTFGVPGLDATPERIAMGFSEFVNPAEIDSSEQPIGRTRRFRESHLDRLHRAGKLTYRQWYAGDWYRGQYEACGFEGPTGPAYGGGVGGGSGPSYGLARTDRQLEARKALRIASSALPPLTLAYIERLVVLNSLPSMRERGVAGFVGRMAAALDMLADHIRFPRPVAVDSA